MYIIICNTIWCDVGSRIVCIYVYVPQFGVMLEVGLCVYMYISNGE